MTEEEQAKREMLRGIAQNTLDIKSRDFNEVRFREGTLEMDELKAIIEYFKNGKAPGPDETTTDFLKDIDNDDLHYSRCLTSGGYQGTYQTK